MAFWTEKMTSELDLYCKVNYLCEFYYTVEGLMSSGYIIEPDVIKDVIKPFIRQELILSPCLHM